MKPRLLTPGPTPVPEETLLELAKPVTFHRSPEFRAVLAEVVEDLKYVFQTKNTVLVLTASGTGGMEAAVSGCVAPGEKAILLISGRWGELSSGLPGPVPCTDARVIDFKGSERTDSRGGVPGYRNKSITVNGSRQWRVVDYFTSGQIRNGTISYTLRQADDDHLEMDLQRGGTLKLRRCQ